MPLHYVCSAIEKLFGHLDENMVDQMMKAADTDGDGDVECVIESSHSVDRRLLLLPSFAPWTSILQLTDLSPTHPAQPPRIYDHHESWTQTDWRPEQGHEGDERSRYHEAKSSQRKVNVWN